VLAVLAVMLSLPSGSASSGEGSSMLSYLSPKRTQALIARESAVAVREAEVARREAEMLVGAPGGVMPAQPSPIACPTYQPSTVTETLSAPTQTIIKEIVKEDSLAPAGWAGPRAEELLDRELRIAEREREISKREENVNRREHDASRRESWIMEQLISLGNDGPQAVEEEYVYEPAGAKRKSKFPSVIAETQYETETKIVVQTVTVPPPANTRLAPPPHPESASSLSTASSPRTTAVLEMVEDDEEDDEPRFKSGSRGSRTSRKPPARWFGGGGW